MRKNNIRRLAQIIAKKGGTGILVHSIPGSPLWMIAERIADDSWALTLFHPMKTAFYQLGLVDDINHLALWKELTALEILRKGRHILVVKKLKARVTQFNQALLAKNNSP